MIGGPFSGWLVGGYNAVGPASPQGAGAAREKRKLRTNPKIVNARSYRPLGGGEIVPMTGIVKRALSGLWSFGPSRPASAPDGTDVAMMNRCLELARTATLSGEFPFAALITRNGEVIVETINRVARDADITRHAELLAVSEAQKLLGRGNLKSCTLYTIIEPCPMCSFAIREARIDRVVFALESPLMGGFSRWDVLGDDGLSSHMPEVFAPPPKVLAGLLGKEAACVWRRWNPIVWGVIRLRGVFRAP